MSPTENPWPGEAMDAARQPDELAMARNLTESIRRASRALNDPDEDRQIQAHIRGEGERAYQAASMAAELALVSIAGDIRRIADCMEGRKR